jgi:hypothetical protein
MTRDVHAGKSSFVLKPEVDSVLAEGMDMLRIQGEEDKEPTSEYRDPRNERSVNVNPDQVFLLWCLVA